LKYDEDHEHVLHLVVLAQTAGALPSVLGIVEVVELLKHKHYVGSNAHDPDEFDDVLLDADTHVGIALPPCAEGDLLDQVHPNLEEIHDPEQGACQGE